jgi:broad specificity phosphatase PhoE
MQKLYFIRHAQTVLSEQGLRAGSSETPLSKAGREQAKLAGRAAKKLQIDRIVSSSMGRTTETARIIAREIGYPLEDVVYTDLFVERRFGVLEEKPYSFTTKVDEYEGVEPLDSLMARVAEGLSLVKSLNATNVLVVGHGSMGRALRTVISPEYPFDQQNRFENAKIVKLWG